MKYCRAGIGIWLCLQLLAGCTGNAPISGAGGQTTNGLTASIVYTGGDAGTNLPFRVRPADFLTGVSAASEYSSGAVVNGITDSSGILNVDSLDHGSYLVEVYDGRGFAVAFEHTTPDSGGRVDAGANTLVPTGAVHGHVPSEQLQSQDWYVQIYGLERLAPVDSGSGAFVFSDLPAGSYTFRLAAPDSEAASFDIDNVEVRSDDTASLPVYRAWSHEATLTLNTTASGADVQGNVANFPVLVRLTQENFDFSQANGAGEDLRFSRADGAPLSFEIGRWDAENRQAELWVKIDTVYGNNDRQYIMMYWGNPDARLPADAPEVFDSTTGFAAVWHLNETAGTRQAADATPNGYPGTYAGGLPNGTGFSQGIAQFLAEPDSDYVDMGDVLDPGMRNISVSIWVRRDSLGIPQALIAKTDGDLPSASYGYLLSIDPDHFPHFNIATGGAQWGDDSTFEVAANRPINDSDTWHHIVAVIDRSASGSCRMYVDGVDCTGKSSGDITRLTDVANALHFRIGTENDNNSSYEGALDEATVAFTVRSADWVRLSYMNQKEQDALVQW